MFSILNLLTQTTMKFWNMLIQLIFGCADLAAVFTGVWIRTRKMYVFDVLAEIALFDSFFPAHGTLKSYSTLTGHNVIVKGEEIVTWKSKTHS